MEVKTWEDVAVKLAAMTPEQRRQPVQCMLPFPSDAEVQEMFPGIAIATVAELGVYKCRSVYDNKYHGDDVVLLLDYNRFAEDGAMAFEFGETGFSPVYGESGPTDAEDQMSPAALADHRVISAVFGEDEGESETCQTK